MNEAYLSALIGGALIGLTASLFLLFSGRVAGVSGITGGILDASRGDRSWRIAFFCGLLAGGFLIQPLSLGVIESVSSRPQWAIIAGGLLVGFGTRLGNGCTSGHGICGLTRRSFRSLAATMTFMATGSFTATLFAQLIGA